MSRPDGNFAVMATRACSRCGLDKELSEFTKDSRRKDGLDVYCRACKRLYREVIPWEKMQEYQNRWRAKNREQMRARGRARYEADPERFRATAARWRERHPERAREKAAKARQAKREFVAEYKAGHGCINCGLKDPRVLDLHHQNGDDKIMAVSQMVSRHGWEQIRLEMDKCRVLCANCHRLEHIEGVS